MASSPQSDFDRDGLPRVLARFNRMITNPLQGLWAPYLVPWAVIVHVGRKSGSRYFTPVMAFRRGDRIAIGLPYGPQTQWLRNLQEVGGGAMRRGGRWLRLDDLQIVDSRDRGLPVGARSLGRLTDRVLIARISPTAAISADM